MIKSSVLVLMATFNGEQFLESQISSVINQKGVDIQLLVRDDGSTDNTIKILESYASKKKLRWYTTDNKGPAYSFLDLLDKSSEYKTDFIAFCDQDDVWLDDKLVCAVERLSEYKEPALYFSRKLLVDEELKKLDKEDIDLKQSSLSFPVLFFKSLGSGCTMVINDELKKILNSYRPEYIQMHDSWFLIVASLFGKVVYDSQGKILYRLHSNNNVGIDSFMKKTKNRVKNLKAKDRSRVAEEIIKGYSQKINDNELEFLTDIVNIKYSLRTRIRLLFSKENFALSFSENFFIRIKILLGWI